MKSSFLLFFSFFIVVFLSAGSMFLDYYSRQLENRCQECEDYLDSKKEKAFLVRVLSKKTEDGAPIWMIVIGILFFVFISIKLIFF